MRGKYAHYQTINMRCLRLSETFDCNTCNEYPCLRCIKAPKRVNKTMNREDVLTAIEYFLDEAEDNDTKDFRIDDNFDSITIISLVD